MSKYDKLLPKILSGRSDTNVAFSELMQLLQRLEFKVRIRGNHHIFTRHDVSEIINLQPKGALAKPGDNVMIHGQKNGWGWLGAFLPNFLTGQTVASR